MLLPELASFTYLAFLATELQLSKYHLFRLQFFKLRKVDVADLLVPQVDIRFDLLSFHIHHGANIIDMEDKHPPFSAPTCDD